MRPICAGLALILGLTPVTGMAKPASTVRSAAVLDGAAFMAANARRPGVKALPSGLQYQVLADSNGHRPGDDDIVTVDYSGTLLNGRVIASGLDADLYVSLQVEGLSEGLKLMPLGAHYRFWVPPLLGHGRVARRSIPALSVLVYDVVLRDFRSKASDGPEQE